MKFVLRCEMPVDLKVEANLLGQEHCFQFEGRKVGFFLSKRYYNSFDEDSNYEDDKIARCYSWRDQKCHAVSVNMIFLTVEISEADGIHVTDEMVLSEGQANKLFWESNAHRDFQESATFVSDIATRAFDYWSRVVRWKTGKSYVGLPMARHDSHPGWRYIASVDPLVHVASFNDVIRATIYEGMSEVDWANIQETLNLQEQPPLWIDAYHDARRRLEMGDVRGAYLEAAVSMESFFRSKLKEALAPLPVEEIGIRKRIESWQVGDLLSRRQSISTLKELRLDERKDWALVPKLFETRNSILHGNFVQLDVSSLWSALVVVKDIIYS